MRRRLLHLSFEASPLQLLLCNSAVEKLSALGFGLCHAAQDSSIAALISRRSQANLQEVLAPVHLSHKTHAEIYVNLDKSTVKTLTSPESGLL